jgi:hypothetical protein
VLGRIGMGNRDIARREPFEKSPLCGSYARNPMLTTDSGASVDKRMVGNNASHKPISPELLKSI